MAKIIKLTPKHEQDTQPIIDNLTPEQLNQMHAFEEEFEQMPEEMQSMVFDMVMKLAEMPEDERNQFLEEMDAMAEKMDRDMGDDYDEGHFDEDDFDDDDSDDDDSDEEFDPEFDYPHFLFRKIVQKFTLRVTLRGLKPAIYRKFNVPSNITLRHLSELLLELMGWENEHLNQFRKGDDYYAPAYQREGEDDFMMGWGRARNHNQEDFTLSDLLTEKGKSIEWEYDFGDSWYHDVKLSSIGDYKEGEPRITFIKGERECPPEDCGGIWGYQELLFIYEKKKPRNRLTSEEKDRLEWYEMDEDFDPNHFDTEFARLICEDYCE